METMQFDGVNDTQTYNFYDKTRTIIKNIPDKNFDELIKLANLY